MLNKYDIRDTEARDQWLDRTGNVYSHHKKAIYKGDEQTVESDADASVSSTKTSGWIGLQIILNGIKQVKNMD